MVNAWSLAASILDGTFDEDYPIMTDKEEHSDAWYDYKRNDPNAENPFTDPVDRARAEFVVGGGNTASHENFYGYENDGLDYEIDLMADVDEQRAHHFNYEPKVAHFYKYHEEEILKDIEEYVSGTYKGHYTGNSHEFRKVQTIDLMASKDLAAAFCQANILKYGSRYGNKDGKNKKDLLKVIHYAMLLAHFDGHYGEPSMPSGNFDQMP
tara:strand:+ start:6458 stop:7087 length:630 start_codon:yes stop_codon:yes gene_type:complete